jgi:serine/threonine-protein kinase
MAEEWERQYRPGERVPGTEYVVIRLEAEGGHGALYLVRHHFLEKKVQMLKTLRTFTPSKDLVERLKREAQMLAAMDHPHIVSVTSGGLTDEKHPRPYFVMERLKGRSLAQILPEAPEGVGIDAALKVTIELCDALEYVHVRHGVVHRDIKPDNIFLHITPRNGSVTKILDFGVAHIVDLEQRYTKQNLFLGTPRYAAPEQIMGEKPVPQTDLYAVGLVLYELLLGHGPFDDAVTFATIATAHTQRPPPPFPKTRRFPEGLEALVLSLLAKEPGQRPKSAERLATQLRQIKRIAEMAEHAKAEDINQTEASPFQNVLTGHRAQLTEAGAPPDVASERVVGGDEAPPSSNPTTEASPLGFVPTLAAETAPPETRVDGRKKPAVPPKPVLDREAETASLLFDAPDQHHSDTAHLPAPRLEEDPGRTGPTSRAQEPATSTTSSTAELAARPAGGRKHWGIVAGIVVAGALGGVLALRGGSAPVAPPGEAPVSAAAPASAAPAPAAVPSDPSPSAPASPPPTAGSTPEPASPRAAAPASRSPTTRASAAPPAAPSATPKPKSPPARVPGSGLE